MDLELKKKVVLVAGSSRGIGRAIARSFLQEGARVIVSGRQQASVEASTRELEEEFGSESVMDFIGDLTSQTAIRACLQGIHERWGALDAVVANIGSGEGVSGWQLEADEWTRVFEINFFGSIRLVNEVIPEFVERKSGNVILISSIAGVEATSAPLPYSSAKSALLSYGKNLSRLVAPLGVRVNVVAPGNILFPGGTWERHVERVPEKVSRYIESEVPMARFGRPEEIADFVVFLCSPKASFATGTCTIIDGGQTRTIP